MAGGMDTCAGGDVSPPPSPPARGPPTTDLSCTSFPHDSLAGSVATSTSLSNSPTAAQRGWAPPQPRTYWPVQPT